jgi:hypothetical protein
MRVRERDVIHLDCHFNVDDCNRTQNGRQGAIYIGPEGMLFFFEIIFPRHEPVEESRKAYPNTTDTGDDSQ